MNKMRLLAFFNLLALAIHIAVAYMTQSGLVTETNVEQISDRYNSLFTPADITFGIWGVVYTGLLLFCIYHFLMSSRHSGAHHANVCVQKMGPWFILNNLGATAWLLIWTNEMITLSVGLIFFQLVALIIIHRRAAIHDPHSPVDFKIFTQFPLSIYFGWLTFAAIANTSIFLLASGWKGAGLNYTAVEWTRIIIGATVFLTLVVVFSRRNVFFGLVIGWGLYGIILKRRSINADLYADLIKTAWIGIGIIGVSCIIQFILNISAKKKLPLFPEAASSVK
jgi:hypothetical protein